MRVTSKPLCRRVVMFAGLFWLSTYFTDPEGNGWEIVWSPEMPLDEQGALTLPKGR